MIYTAYLLYIYENKLKYKNIYIVIIMQNTILIVDKTGKIKETILKNRNIDELYKKAGYKHPVGFKCVTTWNIENLNGKSYNISVYGKKEGRANQENKYEFPPPIDNLLLFNTCIIINIKDNVICSLSTNEWSLIYNHLYGGFEDIVSNDEDDEDDEDEDYEDDISITKSGYMKDGFVVDDDEDEDEAEDEDDDDYDDDDPIKPTKKKTTKKKTTNKVNKNKITNIEKQPNFLDCTNELTEENYVE